MDVTKRYSIAYKGLRNGIHTYDFEVNDALFQAYENSEIKDGACKVHVSLDRSESMLGIDIGIDGNVVTVCDRCLEDCEVPIHFEGRLLVKFSDKVEDYDGEVMWISPAVTEVDLMQYIYESIILSLPYQRVHPDGVCDPAMLERFHIVSEQEFASIEAHADAVQQPDQQDEWAKLESLREQIEAEAASTVQKSDDKQKK